MTSGPLRITGRHTGLSQVGAQRHRPGRKATKNAERMPPTTNLPEPSLTSVARPPASPATPAPEAPSNPPGCPGPHPLLCQVLLLLKLPAPLDPGRSVVQPGVVLPQSLYLPEEGKSEPLGAQPLLLNPDRRAPWQPPWALPLPALAGTPPLTPAFGSGGAFLWQLPAFLVAPLAAARPWG